MMNSERVFIVLTLASLVACVGCIPSAPPETPPEDASPTKTAPPEAVAPPEETEAPAPIPETAAPPDDAAKKHFQVPFDPDETPPGIPMPVITLEPLTNAIGYELQSVFPVDGLDMEGTLTFHAPDSWRLQGRFISDTEAFQPDAPTITSMGQLAPSEAGALEHVPDAAEIVINFTAPMPPPDAPKADAPVSTPFELEVKGPRNARFIIFVLPF